MSVNLSPTGKTHPKYRPDIDGLRTIAVISVLLFHGFPEWLPGGFVGVDVFFVISGFLISSIIIRSLRLGQFSIWHFYERRIRRLFPVLVVVLVFSLGLGWFVLSPLELQSLAKHTVGGAAFVSNLMLAADSGYFSDISDTNPLLHLWSLGIEEQFYLLWPLVLWFFYWRKWPLWLAVVICMVSSFAYSHYLTLGNLKLAFYNPFSRFWEMLAGAALAWWSIKKTQNPLSLNGAALRRHHVLSLAGLIFFIVALVNLNPQSVFPGWRAIWPVLSAVCFIAAGPYAWFNRYVLSRPLMVWVGLISYPLYLWHWPLLAYFHNFSYLFEAQWHPLIITVLLLLSVLLAWLSYRYVEEPLRGGRAGRIKLLGLCAVMGLITVVASAIWLAKGMPKRFAPEVRDVVSMDLRTPEWLGALREGQCHNMVYRDPQLNAEHCLPDASASVVLWGDSQAASLYQALHEWGQTQGVQIGQLTIDATAPYFDAERKNNMGWDYNSISERALEQLRQRPPAVLVLHAFWVAHSQTPEAMQQQLQTTIEKIRHYLPQTEVVILGPIPNWKKPAGQNTFNYFALRGSVVPPFTSFGLLDSAQFFDGRIRDQWQGQPYVHYVSATDYLCDTEQACLIRLPDQSFEPKAMAYVDDSHLSTAATRFLVQKIAPQLEALLP